MTKLALIDAVAKETNYPKNQVEEIVDTFLDAIINALADGHEVQFPGFGTFVTWVRRAYMGTNPRTGEKIPVSKCRITSFHAGVNLKKAVKS